MENTVCLLTWFPIASIWMVLILYPTTIVILYVASDLVFLFYLNVQTEYIKFVFIAMNLCRNREKTKHCYFSRFVALGLCCFCCLVFSLLLSLEWSLYYFWISMCIMHYEQLTVTKEGY